MTKRILARSPIRSTSPVRTAILRAPQELTAGSGASTYAGHDFSQIAVTANETATAQTGSSECAFQLVIDKIEYCFNVRKDSTKTGAYRLFAAAKDKKGNYGIVYSAFISVAVVKGKRTIAPEGLIKLTGSKGIDEQVSIVVDPEKVVAAWDANSPPEETTQTRPWDFVVLVVREDAGKSLPRQIVYFLGEPGEVVVPKRQRVAWFDVKRSEIDPLRPKGEANAETLKPAEVLQLIASKTPVRESLEGFGSDFVGEMVKRPVDIQVDGKTKPVSFNVAAGQPSSSTTFRRSLDLNPPMNIAANFKLGESAVPDGLTEISRAQFDEQIRLVLLYLDEMTTVAIKIYGDTDTVGTATENQTLSEQRAKSVRNYLTDSKRWVVPPAITSSRILAVVGRGQTEAEKYLKTAPGKSDAQFRRIVIEYVQQ